MWELRTLALCMVENLCITDSWPSVFMVPLHLEFIQPCRTAIFNIEKSMCKRTHAIQTSIVKGSTLLLFLSASCQAHLPVEHPVSSVSSLVSRPPLPSPTCTSKQMPSSCFPHHSDLSECLRFLAASSFLVLPPLRFRNEDFP